MIPPSLPLDVRDIVSQHFLEARIPILRLDIRPYPDETIVVLDVSPNNVARAAELANSVDRLLAERGFRGFTTVRSAQGGATDVISGVDRLTDERVTALVNLLTARSRTSEIQPSLEYIADAENKISIATTPRHQLIFGRRGAGKTALLAELKRLTEAAGSITVWLNIQTYRHEPARRAFVLYCQRVCEMVQSFEFTSTAGVPSPILASANQLYAECDSLLAPQSPDEVLVTRLIPKVQRVIRRFLDSRGVRMYVLLDDYHYLTREEQPLLLDMIHGTVRDCDAWLKVTAIKHLCRWFDSDQQMGLEMGQDAAAVDLDVTLQDPVGAKRFLESMLLSYSTHCSISRLSLVFGKESLDRLALASGAVPRDYLILCARAVQQAQKRENAKLVGAQDVNRAAGDAKQPKIEELEDDAASAHGERQEILESLQRVRAFCIDTRSWTCFRIDFRDKEERPNEYARLVGLMDLRLIHLIEPSLSDEHHAGHRSEVYMLDLSQFVGHRVKRKLHMLDLEDGVFVLRETGTTKPPRIGNTGNKRLSLFRRVPLLTLESIALPQ